MGDQVQGLFGDLGAMYDAAAAKAADNSFTQDTWGLSTEVSAADTSRQAVANPRNDWSAFWQGTLTTIVGAGVASINPTSTPGGTAQQGGQNVATTTPATQQLRIGGMQPLTLILIAAAAYLLLKKA